MHLPTQPGVTPFEFSYFLSQHLEQLASGSYWADWLLEGDALIRQISADYVRITFNPSSGSAMNAQEIMKAYKKLRLRLWLLLVMGRIYKFWFLRPIFWIESPLFISSFAEEEQ
jgi:hypothetical protein